MTEGNRLSPAENALVPPWEKFPTYEHHSLGWRMGDGEYYIYNWWGFINSLPSDYESRLKYLKRHQPAPINWFDTVLGVLYVDDEEDREYEESQAEITQLLELGLIKYDVTYETWLQQQTKIIFPWTLVEEITEEIPTPEVMVRHWTREFWFFSRQFNNNRNIEIPEIPNAWKEIEYNLVSGKLGDIDLSKGLLTLAKMFCAGNILTPWQLGLTPADSHESFEMDMGYADAYRFWLMFAFDDDRFLRKMIAKTEMPKEWNEWIEDIVYFIFF